LQDTAKRIAFSFAGERLVGVAFVVAGVLAARLGVTRLLELWREVSPHLPLSLPGNTPEILLSSLPMIFQYFVNTVGSVCAALIGALWFFGGLAETFDSRKKSPQSADFQFPGLVAESLRTGSLLNWPSVPWLCRLLSVVWSRAGCMSPVSYGMFRDAVWSFWKIIGLATVIALIFLGLQVLPGIIDSVFQRRITFVVPSPRPLYTILGFLLLVNVVIALSLIPFRPRLIDRDQTTLPVRGQGDPQLFLALMEEGCRLLTSRGDPYRSGARLEAQNDLRVRASLIENFPLARDTWGKPVGYVCVALVVILLVAGFSRLAHFKGLDTPLTHADFLRTYSLYYLLSVAVAVGLILAGLHLAEWARKLLAIRSFRSYAVLCVTRSIGEGSASYEPIGKRHRAPGGLIWSVIESVDERLASWARNPRNESRFQVQVFWGELRSEAATAQGPRHLIASSQSEALAAAMARIMELPFHVAFAREEEPSEGHASHQGSAAGTRTLPQETSAT